jgi:BirA family biotin operon repressor/biotin-[acetyl-CoA-carboxylase] ligase
MADSQTKGKGQRGNSWESEAGKNLTFSIVLYPTALEARKQFCLSMLAALSCHEALDNYTNGFSIKWPNDIYWKDKKIGGILIENELEGEYIVQSIIGIGLNINQEVFYSDAPNPVSLKQILNVDIDIQEVMMKVVHGIVGGYRQLESNFVITQQAIGTLYRKNLYRHKGLFPYRDAQGEFMAEYQEIEPDGHLILKDEQGMLRRYAFKEVSFVL